VPRAKEHQALKWVRLSDLDQYPMPPADIPLIAALRSYL
jgi:8-oxo-dGTP diphosphatase